MSDTANLIDDTGSGQNIGATNNGTRTNNNNQSNPDSSADDESPKVYTSQLAAFFCLLNVTIGAGLLAMPYVTQTAGLVTSIIMMAFFVSSVIVTCIICAELTVQTDVESYHKIVQVYCHNWLYLFSQAAILLLCFGTAVAYIAVIGDQSDRVFASLYGHDFCYTWYLDRTFIMVAVTLVLIKPLCSAKTVDFLKYAR